jgi:translation initiation factor 2 subunit 2
MDDYQELLKRAKSSLPHTQETVRWEVLRANVQISGKRTTVKNFLEIAKAMRRDPQHLAKFLFKELAAPGALESGQLILQGKFNSDFVTKRIDDYAREFVICSECGKPDTQLQRSDRLWMMKCEACGAKKPVRAI